MWRSETGDVDRDEIVTVEVMVQALDADWWRGYARDLARAFGQEEIVVRAIAIERLSGRTI